MKKEHSRLRLLNIICGVILLAGIAVLAAMIITDYRNLSASRSEHISDTETTGSQQQTVPVSTSSASDSDTHILESVYTLDDPEAYLDNTLFLGDSRTLALSLDGLIPDYNTFAENGINHIDYMERYWNDSVTGAYGTIDQIAAIRKPKRIYVALGINGISFLEEDRFTETFRELIVSLKTASPDSDLIIEAMLPVSASYETENPTISNLSIRIMNDFFQQLAAELDAYYLPIDSCVSDDSNAMAAEFDRGDGLHYNSDGCLQLYNYLITHPAVHAGAEAETAFSADYE